jgi:NADH-quinone oxidoreductase subunit H
MFVLLFAIIKILIVILFLMNTAAILTWAERRQSAMIQDRVGPNRAVVYVPGTVLKGLFAGVGAVLAIVVFLRAFADVSPPVKLDIGFGLTELSILATWVFLAMLHAYARRTGVVSGVEGLVGRVHDPRAFFYAGLFAHVLGLIGRISLADPSGGLGDGLARAAFFVGPLWLGLLLIAAGAWAFTKVPSGKVGLRLMGLLHPLADGAKMAFKEDFVPPKADRLLHGLGPLIALFTALVTFAVVPFGDVLCVPLGKNPSGLGALFDFSHFPPSLSQQVQHALLSVAPRNGVCTDSGVPLQVANLNVGILYMFALAGTGIIGAAVAGWSSDNKFALLGGLRAASQMVSYEVAMGLSLVGAFMTYATLRLDDMVRWQSEHAWGIFVQPVAFFLFLTAAIAEQKRTPFDAPEGESEIVAGYFLEYSGLKWGMFMFGEYMEVVTSSALLTTIFFGGYALPFVHRDGLTIAFGDNVILHQNLAHWVVILLGVVAFFGKTVMVCWAQLFIRWTVPRFRYDQIMRLGWRMLLPAAILNMLVTGIVLLAIDQMGPGVSGTLHFLGDLSQALVFVVAAVAFVLGVSAFLKPTAKRATAVSSSADFAKARGGTKMTPMQA